MALTERGITALMWIAAIAVVLAFLALSSRLVQDCLDHHRSVGSSWFAAYHGCLQRGY